MATLKFLFSLLLGLAVILAETGTVHAAPPQQDEASITGTIQSVVVEAGSEFNLQTVVITLLVKRKAETVRVSVETAIGLRLIALDEEGNPILGEDNLPVVDTSLFGTDLTVDPIDFLSPATEEKQQPVGSKVAAFFTNFISVDYEIVSTSHANGFGFGTITQALWMTQKLGGDATLFQNILTAKQNNDYASVALPDGTIPQNWGQFKKTVLQGEDNKNPGDVISNGNDKPDNSGNGNGWGDPLGNSKDKDDDHNWRKDRPGIPPGQSKEKDNNRNSDNPVIPPGQNKDKDKDKENNGNSENPPGQNKDNNGNRNTR